MLVLSRTIGESFACILDDGTQVKVTVIKMFGGKVRLAIEAPQSVAVWRTEMLADGEIEKRGFVKKERDCSFAGLMACRRCGSDRVSVYHRGVSCRECFARWPMMTVGEAERLIDAEVTRRWNAAARPEHTGAGE